MGSLPNDQILKAFRWGPLRHCAPDFTFYFFSWLLSPVFRLLTPDFWLLTPVLLHFLKMRPQPGIRGVKRFRHYAGLVEDGQAARVAGPAGDDLNMEVLRKSRACDLADIDAYVQPLRVH